MARKSQSPRNSSAVEDYLERILEKIAQRHKLLTDFLKLLGLDDRVIYHDVEGMEHHISAPTLRAIESLTVQLRRRPALLAKLQAAAV
jgi:Mn-dependent DtxR family transcriptional regulator